MAIKRKLPMILLEEATANNDNASVMNTGNGDSAHHHHFQGPQRLRRRRRRRVMKTDISSISSSSGESSSTGILIQNRGAAATTTNLNLMGYQDDNNKQRRRKRQKRSSILNMMNKIIIFTSLLAVLIISSFVAFAPMWGYPIYDTHIGMSQETVNDGAILHQRVMDHVVLTRFMQNQPHLNHLANARLQLFKSICVPSLVGQTTQDFYWIIQTDPELYSDTMDQLKEILAGAHNDNHKKQLVDRVFLLASNDNLIFNVLGKGKIHHDHDMLSPLLNLTRMHQVLSPSKDEDIVLMGNGTLLRQLIQDWTIGGVPLLQTRLDADDALQLSVLEYYQDSFRRKLADHDGSNFFYFWCLKRHMKWYPSASNNDDNEEEEEEEEEEEITSRYNQSLRLVSRSRFCETPGLTLGTSSSDGEQAISIPLYDHDILYKRVALHPSCRSSIDDCLEMVAVSPLLSFRAQTWASAGISIDYHDYKKSKKQKKNKSNIAISLEMFNHTRDNLERTTKYFAANEWSIISDNFMGQCTRGQPCKNETWTLLEQRIEYWEKEQRLLL